MVGGNLTKEGIPWATANSWFMEIDKLMKLAGEEIAQQALKD